MQLRRIPASTFKVTIATSVGAYAANRQVGVLVKIPDVMEENLGAAFLRSISLVDKAKQKISTDFLFFSDAPTVISADNAAADIDDAELASKFIGVINVAAADYVDLANSAVAAKQGLGLMLKTSLSRSKDIWVLAVTRGAPTYASTSDLILTLGVEKC